MAGTAGTSRFLRRQSKEKETFGVDTELEPSPAEIGDLDSTIYDYILSNEGRIAVVKASEDLGLPVDRVREAVQRLTIEGRLNPRQQS